MSDGSALQGGLINANVLPNKPLLYMTPGEPARSPHDDTLRRDHSQRPLPRGVRRPCRWRARRNDRAPSHVVARRRSACRPPSRRAHSPRAHRPTLPPPSRRPCPSCTAPSSASAAASSAAFGAPLAELRERATRTLTRLQPVGDEPGGGGGGGGEVEAGDRPLTEKLAAATASGSGATSARSAATSSATGGRTSIRCRSMSMSTAALLYRRATRRWRRRRREAAAAAAVDVSGPGAADPPPSASASAGGGDFTGERCTSSSSTTATVTTGRAARARAPRLLHLGRGQPPRRAARHPPARASPSRCGSPRGASAAAAAAGGRSDAPRRCSVGRPRSRMPTRAPPGGRGVAASPLRVATPPPPLVEAFGANVWRAAVGAAPAASASCRRARRRSSRRRCARCRPTTRCSAPSTLSPAGQLGETLERGLGVAPPHAHAAPTARSPRDPRDDDGGGGGGTAVAAPRPRGRGVVRAPPLRATLQPSQGGGA